MGAPGVHGVRFCPLSGANTRAPTGEPASWSGMQVHPLWSHRTPVFAPSGTRVAHVDLLIKYQCPRAASTPFRGLTRSCASRVTRRTASHTRSPRGRDDPTSGPLSSPHHGARDASGASPPNRNPQEGGMSTHPCPLAVVERPCATPVAALGRPLKRCGPARALCPSWCGPSSACGTGRDGCRLLLLRLRPRAGTSLPPSRTTRTLPRFAGGIEMSHACPVSRDGASPLRRAALLVEKPAAGER